MDMNAAVLATQGGEGGVILVGAILVAIIVLVFCVFKDRERRKNLEAVASRFQGNIIPSFWSGDRVEFIVDGADAELTYHQGNRNRSPFTRLRIRRSPPGSLRVVPEGVFESLRKIFGEQDIQVGDPRFDAAYLVQGSPEHWVRQLLDPEVRRRITMLASLGDSFLGRRAVSLEAGPAGVTITCGRNFTDSSGRLNAFLEHALAVFGRIQGPLTEGVKVLSADEHAHRGECPVCANPLDGATRRCDSCATPHHRECWDYFGGCAIYGCARRGGRRT